MPAAVAMVLALAGGLIDWRGVLFLIALAAACQASRVAPAPVSAVAHAAVVALSAGLFLHALPGFGNPRVLTEVVLGADAMPYTKYLNFDKGMAGILLLGLYMPAAVRSDEGRRHVTGFLWRFALLVIVVMALAVISGYVTWDPKVPAFWPLWSWSMVVLTALPEEAVFRAVIQESLASRLDKSGSAYAFVIAGLLFGLAHLAGGPHYVVVASVAGVGYGWIYASTRSIAAAILAHAGLNAIHFFFFTYPSLAQR